MLLPTHFSCNRGPSLCMPPKCRPLNCQLAAALASQRCAHSASSIHPLRFFPEGRRGAILRRPPGTPSRASRARAEMPVPAPFPRGWRTAARGESEPSFARRRGGASAKRAGTGLEGRLRAAREVESTAHSSAMQYAARWQPPRQTDGAGAAGQSGHWKGRAARDIVCKPYCETVCGGDDEGCRKKGAQRHSRPE